MSPVVLWLEREVVDTLITSADAHARARVVAWVDSSLAAMPEVLRAGVAAVSTVLGAWARARGLRGARLVDALEASRVPLVAQHLRLLRSLVLFGDLEIGGRLS